MLQRLLIITLTLCSLTASAQWQQTGSKVRYVNGLGIPTKDTAAGVAADSSQILIRPADSSLYIKYKRTWVKVGAGGGGTIGGSGTTNYVPKFTAGTTLGNSSIVDSASAVAMTITPSGNVGIGTTSPVRNLTLSGSSAVYQNIQGGASSDVGLLLGPIGNDALGRIVYSNANNNLQLWTNATQQVTINSSGNVGIGYTAPATKLSVDGTTLINTNTDNGVDKLQVSGSAAFTGNINVSGANRSILNTSNNALILGTNNIERLRIDSVGNVGIGETNPPLDLYIKNSSVDITGYYIENTTAGASPSARRLAVGMGGSTAFGNANWVNSGIIEGQTANGLYIGFTGGTLRFGSSSRATRMTMLENGRFLINTTSDNGVDLLQVNGSISGIGFKQAYVTKTGAYTATNDDYVIDCTSGTFTVTLPASSGRTGRILIIKNSGAGTITVDGNGAETIDGAATYSLAVQYATVQIMSDGTNWKIISKF
jgi:hypothetical protein